MIQKQNINLPFAQGLDTKTDPKQVAFGKFLSLKNTVFDNQGLLKKRNGFNKITTFDASSITTYKDNLLGVGSNLSLYSAENNQVLNVGAIEPLRLNVQPIVRSATSQLNCDVAVDNTGLACSAWLDSDGSSYYQVIDSNTGQTILPKVALVSTATQPKVFTLGNYFIVMYLATISASTHLQYIAVPKLNPSNPLSAADLATDVYSLTTGYDGVVANNRLYFAYTSTVSSNSIKISWLTNILIQLTPIVLTGYKAPDRGISLCADVTQSTAIIWIVFNQVNGGNESLQATAYDADYNLILSPTIIGGPDASFYVGRIASSASDLLLTVFYRYPTSGNPIYKATINTSGSGITNSYLTRSVNLASKAIIANGNIYFLGIYEGTLQPTYFLFNNSGNVVCKIAYQNAGIYSDLNGLVLPQININNNVLSFGYLYKSQLSAVNKTQGAANSAAIYSQTGINLAKIEFNTIVNTAEIGGDLHLTGGFLWMYDGVKPVEHGFFLYPEGTTTAQSVSTGSLSVQQYYYQITYEWTDNEGNLHRSAPSIPKGQNVTGSNNTVTLTIPTLRLTYKIDNPVRIVIYRWSAAQQIYYRITSIDSPLLNDITVDTVSYVDTQADSSISGNDILYTTGGVVENICAPSFTDISLFKSRLFGIDSEDQNLLWYSKLVIESTPVEMSDLFTLYVAPTTGVQGSTGNNKVLASLDDKLIIFKDSAIYYITGNGPDSTGANNDFSEPIFVSSSVGCSNPNSLAYTPNGLMFQSNKGIWLLTRDLGTQYIGAPVEKYNSNNVLSAQSIPGTNQVRFVLDNGITLMYDYYYGQWGEFTIPAISGTLYNSKHTVLQSSGFILQEYDGYFDNSHPVLLSFETNWLNLAGLQGYERAYYFYLLGEFLTPHKLLLQISYDYKPVSQSVLITPNNYSPAWGSDSTWGQSSPWSGIGNQEQWRVFFQQQRCQSFKINFSEIYDASYANSNNAGLTLSGLNFVFGIKKGFKPILAQYSRG